MSSQRTVRAVIPVAGLATRMHPVSRAVPKELLPLGRRPVLHHVVAELAAAGVREFLMITSERTSAIERYFARDELLDTMLVKAGLAPGWWAEDFALRELTFEFTRQEEARGVADAVHRTRDFVQNDPFFLHMGDSVMTGDPGLLRRLLEAHESAGAVLSVAVQHATPEEICPHATCVPDGDSGQDSFRITGILEKPRPEELRVDARLVGRYLISAPMLEVARPVEPRYSLFGSLGAIFPDREALAGPLLAVWCLPGSLMHDVGTLDDYLRAQAYFALHDAGAGPRTRRLLEN